MAIWIWHWRRTMLEKGPWIARTEFPHFARRATTCRKCRMPISGQDRGASKACGPTRARFTKILTPTAEPFSPTTKVSQASELARASRVSARVPFGWIAPQVEGRKARMLGQNFLHKVFARVSPVFLAAGLAFASPQFSQAKLSGTRPEKAHSPADSDTHNKTGKRQAASTQFARAEDLRAQLNSRPADKRTLSEYKQVVSSYRRVYLITPHAGEVPDALLAVAELYTEIGERFRRRYYHMASDSHQIFSHEHPSRHYGHDDTLR